MHKRSTRESQREVRESTCVCWTKGKKKAVNAAVSVREDGREKERGREGKRDRRREEGRKTEEKRESARTGVCVCVCVYGTEREEEREREREGEGETYSGVETFSVLMASNTLCSDCFAEALRRRTYP
jgi:hypothetical protein